MSAIDETKPDVRIADFAEEMVVISQTPFQIVTSTLNDLDVLIAKLQASRQSLYLRRHRKRHVST